MASFYNTDKDGPETKVDFVYEDGASSVDEIGALVKEGQ